MRKILFKAKCLGEGNLYEQEWAVGFFVNEIMVDFEKGSAIFIFPSTACQFTGIYDKNNNEIFEHDLVQNVKTKAVYEVVWNDVYACYSFCDMRQNKIVVKNFADTPTKDMAIVGNIYDKQE